MKPSQSTSAFSNFAESRGVDLKNSTAHEGIALMFDFYHSVSPQGCGGPNGDMLLFQWGTYDWGSGKHFQVDITRQFIEENLEDDDAISQMNLTYLFPLLPEHESIGSGNRWCDGPTEYDLVRAFALNSPALAAVRELTPVSVELGHSYV